MSIEQTEYKWRKTVHPVRRESKDAPKCTPDMQFAPLDWHDFIEISPLYSKEEHKILTDMLDDITANIPEVRSLLRQTKDPLVHFQISSCEDEMPLHVHPNTKITLKPHTESKPQKNADGSMKLEVVRAKPARRVRSGDFHAIVALKEIAIEPSMIHRVPAANMHGNHYDATCAEIFIHELVHQTMPCSPIELLLQDIASKTTFEAYQNNLTLKNILRNPLQTMQNVQILNLDSKQFENERRAFCERMTVPVTNMIGQRYFGTTFRDKDYFASVPPPQKGDAGRFRKSHRSNLLPLTYIDLEGSQCRRAVEAFCDLKKQNPEAYREFEKKFVDDLRKSYKDGLSL